jgi:MYXO-CTERM domain-containing protein
MGLKTSLLAAAVLLLCASASAQAPVVHPPPPASSSFEPMEPNPYFVQDEHDPRVLRRAPGFEAVGIDRGYVERMVRGDLPKETLDEIERDAPEAAFAPLPLPSPLDFALPALPFAATVVSGDIVVIDGGTATVNTQSGTMFNHNGNGLQHVVGSVWQRLGDEYDFITVMTTFKDPGAAGYYLPLRQDVTGLGECNFNSGATFGCVFDQLDSRLQGFIFMNSISYWRDWDRQMDGVIHPLTSFDANVYAVMAQEVGHRWGAGLRFVDPRSGAVSKKLLGRDESHWAAWVHSEASIMDGWEWTPEGNQFVLTDDMRRFSTLDLYAMGALPVAAAKPFFFLDNARFVANQFVGNQPVPADAALQIPSVSLLGEYGVVLKATGERVDLSIQDIVNAEGNRCPAPDNTQKSFKQALVLVTGPGQTAASVQNLVQELELMRATWEQWWDLNTDNALSLCTDLAGECVHAEASLGKAEIEGGDDGVVSPGDSFTLRVPVGAEGGVLQNARVRVQLAGNGAAQTRLESESISVGDVSPGSAREVEIPLSLDGDYGCGVSVIARVFVESDNAQTRAGEYRIFPGYKQIFAADFDDGPQGFSSNLDNLDEVERGDFMHEPVRLNCTMTTRTPEQDASPGKGGAWVTGSAGLELKGTTSLWAPEIDITGAIAPEVRFMYWLDSESPNGGKLTVRVSGTGKGFKEARVYDEPYHGWVLGRVNLTELYDELPEKLWVLFEVEGDGRVEAGIDEFVVLDRAAGCLPAPSGCGCAAGGRSERAPAGAALLFGLAALFVRRRR